MAPTSRTQVPKQKTKKPQGSLPIKNSAVIKPLKKRRTVASNKRPNINKSRSEKSDYVRSKNHIESMLDEIDDAKLIDLGLFNSKDREQSKEKKPNYSAQLQAEYTRRTNAEEKKKSSELELLQQLENLKGLSV